MHNPAYAEWKQSALREISAAAERGDPLALRQMSHSAMLDGKRAMAIAYWTAYVDADPRVPKEAAPVVTQQYATGLPEAGVKVAVANGHARTFGGMK